MADGSTNPSLIERYLLGRKEEQQNEVVNPVEETEAENESAPVTASEKESIHKTSSDKESIHVTPSETDFIPPEESSVAADVEETDPHPSGDGDVVQTNEVDDDSSTVSVVVGEIREDESPDAQADSDIHEIKIETAPADSRFPTTNQTKHCFTRYVEYHRCIAKEGEGSHGCTKFAKYYRSLCPGEWVERWNEQRENGTFPGPL